jgi:uncharacterized membrane-anchored protein
MQKGYKMDWNKLQRTLFELDPVDPREDLRKLAESAGQNIEAAPTKDYVAESVEVAQGSMPVEGNYSIADFAALAGVTLNESQKTGSAGQAKGKDAMPKAEPGRTKHPLKDKLVGEDNLDEIGARDALKRGWDNHNTPGAIGIENPLKKLIDPSAAKPEKSQSTTDQTKTVASKKPKPGDWKSFLQQHTTALQQIAADPMKRRRFETWLSKWNEDIEEAEVMKFKVPNTVKQRDPNWRDMEALRKSGAAGTHKDKKKDMKSGKVKHKSQQYESIKDMLYAKLAEKK